MPRTLGIFGSVIYWRYGLVGMLFWNLKWLTTNGKVFFKSTDYIRHKDIHGLAYSSASYEAPYYLERRIAGSATIHIKIRSPVRRPSCTLVGRRDVILYRQKKFKIKKDMAHGREKERRLHRRPKQCV